MLLQADSEDSDQTLGYCTLNFRKHLGLIFFVICILNAKKFKLF